MRSFRHLARLGDDRKICGWVTARFHVGVADRVFPVLRDPPDPEASCIVVSDDGTPAGFAVYWRPFEHRAFVWLDVLWIDAVFRRRGHATALIQHLQERCAGSELGLGTVSSNAAMHALVKKAGFHPTSTQYALQPRASQRSSGFTLAHARAI